MLNLHTLILTVSLLALAAVTIWLKWQQRRETYEAILAPALAALGLELVSSQAPRPLDTGPFPPEGSRWARLVPHRGKYVERRIVQFRDRGGQVREAWARLEFEDGQFARIAWKPELESFAAPHEKP